ncbi:MAG: serine racemase VanT catalytic subunit [Clostridiales bacterium]|nr:serine racemase VanT catalytic subunit [Clostridiales bacterium]
MKDKKHYGGLDAFRLIAALLVIAIHTSPFASFNANADFFLTRILARLAVPFFFMVTGQFVLSKLFKNQQGQFSFIWKYIKKILLLYGIAILLYLPIAIYAEHYQNLNLFSALKLLLFDGTFYHLWYFPALVLGILLLYFFQKFFSIKACAAIAASLYLIGLFGDSYWGIIAPIDPISSVYKFGFQIFSYTRNGLFMAPLFIIMGALIETTPKLNTPFRNVIGFIVSFLLMSTEGFILHYFQLPRHDSMYLFLPACMYFLYQLLLNWNVRSSKFFRPVSLWIYILHPAAIIAVRAAAKLLNAAQVLIENSIIYFMSVSALSLCAALSVSVFAAHCKKKPFTTERAWIEINRNALYYNVSVLRSLAPENSMLMPVIKANAYGHGAVLIAKELNRIGINSFCVACLSEGIELRKNGIKGEILILGYTHPEQLMYLKHYRLTQTVIDSAYAAELNRYGRKLRVHIGIDTGMHRLGISCQDAEQLLKIFAMKNLKITGIFTHLCSADSENPQDQKFTNEQANAFFNIANQLKEHGLVCPKMHLQSSYGILNYPEFGGDYVRTGIALYGMRSSKSAMDRSCCELKPILSLKARIAAIKELKPGESAGYNFSFTADRPTKTATLTIGYADGLPRALSCGVGAVLINGHRAPIIGYICMDQTIVDITDIPEVQTGSTAILIGSSGTESISAYEIAEQTATITNEILSRLGSRIKRIIS